MSDAKQTLEAVASVIPAPLKSAVHLGADCTLPYVDLGDGSAIQLLHVDLNTGLWISRVRFQPGCTIERHYHTGSVFAVTLEGNWYYKEYPEAINGPGSYLFEPAGSVHTLTISQQATAPALVWFAVYGANVNIAADGAVSSIVDAAQVLGAYRALAADADLGELIVID